MDLRVDELSDRHVTLVPFDVARDGADLRAMAQELGTRIETWPYYNPPSDWIAVWLANIEASLADLQRHCAEQGLPLVHNETNHQRLTPIGTLKRTWLSPDTCACVTDAPIPDALLLATMEGFRDFHPALAAANLAIILALS